METDQYLSLHWADKPVSAARTLDNFSATEVGQDEIVLFDNERLTYHTLNKPAFSVWQLCDGVRTSREISDALGSGASLTVHAVELAVVELAEAGLLESDLAPRSAHTSRRQLVKLAVAGAVGVAAIPVVSSITAPSVLANHTCGANGTVPQGQHCVCDSECGAGNCCCGSTSNSTPRTCGDRAGASSNCSGGPQVCIA